MTGTRIEPMATPLHFSAFVMNTNSHIQHGLWRHPSAQQADFNDVNLWITLAKKLETGNFDAIFFADVVGLYGPVNGSYEVNAREGLQIPSNDPSVLLSALAVSTQRLGLAFTSSIIQSHPFEFARRVSTLDAAAGLAQRDCGPQGGPFGPWRLCPRRPASLQETFMNGKHKWQRMCP